MLKKGQGKVRGKLNGHPVETLYLQFLFITMLNEGDERVSAFREKIHFSQENGPFLPLLPPIRRMILVAGPSMVLEFIMACLI